VFILKFDKPFGCLTFPSDQMRVPEDFELMKSLGIMWCRHFFFNWNEGEPNKGHFNFSSYDKIVQFCDDFGITLLPILGGDIPLWAGSDPRGPPDRLEDFANFVYKTVKRYKDYVKVWEIWNEPDIGIFWRGTYEQFADLLILSSIAAKRADPNCQIISGVNGCEGIPKESFLSVMRQKGVFNHVDGVSLHWFPQQGNPPLPPEAWEEALKAHKLAIRGINHPLKFWITEAGFTSAEPWGEEDQAKRIFKGIVTILGTGIAEKMVNLIVTDLTGKLKGPIEGFKKDVEAFLDWNPPKEGTTSPKWDRNILSAVDQIAEQWSRFGLVREDFSLKKSAKTHQLLASALSQRFSNANHLFLLEFKHPITYHGFTNAKGLVLALWNQEFDINQEISITVSSSPRKSVTSYTYTGEETHLKFLRMGDLIRINKVNLISDNPILLTFT
jgi:hypothetical protein